MIRGIVVCLLTAALLSVVPFAGAQQPKKVYRIGYLSGRSAGQEKVLLPAFLQGLGELEYTEGKNIVIERRHVAGQSERLRELAAELVRLKVDVIVASSGDIARAAKEVTTTIPIVFTVSADPVGEGLVVFSD